MTTIALIPARSLNVEASLLQELRQRGFGRGSAIPVLDDGILPGRLLNTLAASGVDARIAESLESLPPAAGAAQLSLPGALITSAGVDEGIRRLAAGLGVQSTLSFPVSAEDLRRELPSHNKTVLLVLDPVAVRAAAVLKMIEALEQEGIGWGLIYSSHPIEARFTLLKTLLVSEITAAGTFVAFSEDREISSAPAPEDQSAHASGGAGLWQNSCDVLVVSGHANALDLSLGKSAILCAREGLARPAAGADVLPCFADGNCFRQNHGDRRLVGVDQIQTKILVLNGCNLLSLAQSSFRATASLVYQAGQSGILAAIAASAPSVAKEELDLLCLALIAEGFPLCQVVREVNRVRRDVLGHSTGLPPGVGPLVLMGNPVLRLRGFPLQTALCQSVPDDNTQGKRLFRIDPAGIPLAQGAGTLLRASLPPVKDLPFLALRSEEQLCRTRAILCPQTDRTHLYLWVKCAASPAEQLPQVLLEMQEGKWIDPVLQAMTFFLQGLGFWTLFLESHRQAVRRRGLPVDEIDHLLGELPAFASHLSSIALSLQPNRGELFPWESARRMRDSVCLELNLWSYACLQAVLLLIRCLGNVHSYGAPPYYRLDRKVDAGEPCFCGQGVLTGQVFKSVTAGERVEFQCGICGATADEDGRRLLKVVQFPQKVRAGETITCRCEYRAPDDELLQIHLVLLLDAWMSRLVTGETHYDMVVPAARSSVQLTLELPSDLVEGVYPLLVAGIVNGSPYIIRQLIQVASAGGN